MIDNRPIFLDNASTTPVDRRVFDEMAPYFIDFYANASSKHEFGIKTRKAIENARSQVSNLINSKTSEVIFTSGSTASRNLCLII